MFSEWPLVNLETLIFGLQHVFLWDYAYFCNDFFDKLGAESLFHGTDL